MYCNMNTFAMDLNYSFPNITILSVQRQRGNEPCCIFMRNNDEEHDGYMRVELLQRPYLVRIDRYYLYGMHQGRVAVQPEKYKEQLGYCKLDYVGGVLTRYCGYNTLYPSGARYPLFKKDDDMIHAIETICQDYFHFLNMPKIILIQKHVRGYISRRRYNFNWNRVRIVKEIRALPPGVIVSTFVGGQDYHAMMMKWKSTSENNNCVLKVV